jgi:hypothetical protein
MKGDWYWIVNYEVGSADGRRDKRHLGRQAIATRTATTRQSPW